MDCCFVNRKTKKVEPVKTTEELEYVPIKETFIESSTEYRDKIRERMKKNEFNLYMRNKGGLDIN